MWHGQGDTCGPLWLATSPGLFRKSWVPSWLHSEDSRPTGSWKERTGAVLLQPQCLVQPTRSKQSLLCFVLLKPVCIKFLSPTSHDVIPVSYSSLKCSQLSKNVKLRLSAGNDLWEHLKINLAINSPPTFCDHCDNDELWTHLIYIVKWWWNKWFCLFCEGGCVKRHSGKQLDSRLSHSSWLRDMDLVAILIRILWDLGLGSFETSASLFRNMKRIHKKFIKQGN